MEQSLLKLFVYGTLLHPQVRQTLFETPIQGVPATLLHWGKYASTDGYFFIKPKKNSSVTGEIIFVTNEQMKWSDWWEEYPETYQRE